MPWFDEEKDKIVAALQQMADAQTRQAEVMERDVESEALPKDIETAVQNTADNVAAKYIAFVHDMAVTLDSVITATYLSEFEKTKAIRKFQKTMVEFDGIDV